MDAVMEIEPISSMERDLMDRDREGQLYLETRRQRALVDMLDNNNRASFLSTITPPSTSPSSAASSLFQEPFTSSSRTDVVGNSTDSTSSSTRHAAVTTASACTGEGAAPATAPNASTTPRTLAPPVQNIIPLIKKKKSRQRSSSGRGRALVPNPEHLMPVVPISPSSLEYQLTANLLKYPAPSPSAPSIPSTADITGTRSRSRSVSKPHQHKRRRDTVNRDTRIDTNDLTTTSRSTEHNRRLHPSNEEKDCTTDDMITRREQLEDDLEEATASTTVEAMTPTTLWGSTPSSPVDGFPPSNALSALGQQVHSQSHTRRDVINVTLPSLPPSPPLPPLPPKSPRSLIAHYFPGSLPPPPSRDRGPFCPIDPILASKPSFKTPTFGPAFADSRSASVVPSPSTSTHFAHSTHTSDDDPSSPSSLSNTASPSVSALGLPVSSRMQQGGQGPRVSSDLDLPISTNPRARTHHHHHHHHHHVLLLPLHQRPSFTNDNGLASSLSVMADTEYPIVTTTTPIYPRNLMPITTSTSTTTNSNNSAIPTKTTIQRPVAPYVRDLVPGKEDEPTNALAAAQLPSSTNTSRDLEMVLEEITGRIRTNRTSLGPWSSPSYYYHHHHQDHHSCSPWDEKPLPPVRREKGSRYWVFRDQDGIVPGPFLFLFGHLCPILWWIGSIYPSIEHPDHHLHTLASKTSISIPISISTDLGNRLRSDNEDDDQKTEAGDFVVEDHHPVVQWLQKRLRAAGVRIASISTSTIARSSKQHRSNSDDQQQQELQQQQPEEQEIATLQVVRISEEMMHRGTMEDSTNSHHSNNLNSSLIHVPAHLLFPPTAVQVQAAMEALTHHQNHEDDNRHGPWSAEDHASSLFEQRMTHDRKVLRYELDLRWRRINLIWSLGSFVIAIAATAIVLAII